MTVWALLVEQRWFYAGLFAACGLAVGVCSLTGNVSLMLVWIYFLAGLVVQSVATLKATADMWPATWELIDWEKAERLLNAVEPDDELTRNATG